MNEKKNNNNLKDFIFHKYMFLYNVYYSFAEIKKIVENQDLNS